MKTMSEIPAGEDILHLKESGWNMRHWGLLILAGSAAGFLQQFFYDIPGDPAILVILGILAAVGMAGLLFMGHRHEYLFDRQNGSGRFLLPARFHTAHRIVSFSLNDLLSLDMTPCRYTAQGCSRCSADRSVRTGLRLVLKDRKGHCLSGGMVFRRRDEARQKAARIADFCGIPWHDSGL